MTALKDAVRIPIAGPAPFNTLAYLRYETTPLFDDVREVEPGHVVRKAIPSPSPLVIGGYNAQDGRQRLVEHCSTGTLTELGASSEGTFIAAVDSVDVEATIDDAGRVIFTWHLAQQYGAIPGISQFVCAISSWVMFYEPRRLRDIRIDQGALVRDVHVAVGRGVGAAVGVKLHPGNR